MRRPAVTFGPRLAWVTALVAVGAGTLALVPAIVASGEAARAGLTVGVPGAFALTAALVQGIPRLVPGAIALLAASYAILLIGDDTASGTAAPLVALALIVATECAWWSLEARRLRTMAAAQLFARGWAIATRALLGAAAGAVVLLVGADPVAPTVWATIAAIAATLGLAAGLAALARTSGAGLRDL